MPRVMHFEIPADDTDRASEFYTKVFGWKINKWDGPIDYWLISTEDGKSEGINGALMLRDEQSTSVINIIDVPDIDKYINEIKDAGGEILTEKMAVPGVGYSVYFKDTEGNTFGLMEDDTSAK